MKVCFVFLPGRYNEASSDIPAIGNQGGKFPPMQFAYLAAVLEKAGHDVNIIDANALELTKEKVTELIKDFRADIIGFSTGVVMFRETVSWIKYIKKETMKPIVVGGDILTYYPKEALSCKEIDYGVIGYDENSIVQLVESLNNQSKLKMVNGLVYRREGKIKINPPGKTVKDIALLPLPARHLLPNEKYYEFYTKEPFTIMMTSSGCACNCSFCFDKTDKFTERAVQDVIEEIKDCYYNHGIREIDFRDRTFTQNRERAIQICQEIKRNALEIKWSCMTRIDLVDDELLKEMKEAGCVHIKYGIESGSEKLLREMGKYVLLDKIKRNIELTKKHGIEAYGFFMIGSKGETKETIRNTIRFAKELGLDYAHFQRYTIWPNRAEYHYLKEELGYDLWKEWVTYLNFKIERRNLSNLNENELNSALKRAYLEFYFRPSYLFKRLKKVNSVKILVRSLNAAFDILTDGLYVKYFKVLKKHLQFSPD